MVSIEFFSCISFPFIPFHSTSVDSTFLCFVFFCLIFFYCISSSHINNWALQLYSQSPSTASHLFPFYWIGQTAKERGGWREGGRESQRKSLAQEVDPCMCGQVLKPTPLCKSLSSEQCALDSAWHHPVPTHFTCRLNYHINPSTLRTCISNITKENLDKFCWKTIINIHC